MTAQNLNASLSVQSISPHVEESDGGVYSDEDDDVSEEVDVVMGGESANALTAMRK